MNIRKVGTRMFYAHHEIFQQGDALKRTMDCILEKAGELRGFFDQCRYGEIVFSACGSSYWASMAASMTLQDKLGKPCSAVKSGDIVLEPEIYKNKYRDPLVILPSRSGSTTETLIAAEMFKTNYQSKILAIVEYGDSPVEKYADFCIHLPWANETSVCQTRSFSCLYLAMIIIAALLGDDEGMIKDMETYLHRFPALSEAAEEKIQFMLKDFPLWDSLVSLGYGRQYGVAVEGAYINIEMAQLPAHYYGTLEWRHGPIVLGGGNYLTAMTLGQRETWGYEERMAEDTKKTGARVLAIAGEPGFEGADYACCLGWDACPETIALYSIMILQGIAYYQALKKGLDPDKPGELSPWISL